MRTTVWLTDRAAESIDAEAERAAPCETGGVLLGWRSADWDDIVIAAAIGPGPNARHERYRFFPDGEWTDDQVASIYEASGRLITYVGDWHSHPGGTTRLSRTDMRTLKAIACRPEARCPRPVMIVAAGADGEWHLSAHLLRHRRAAMRSALSVAPRLFTPDWATQPLAVL